MIDWRDQIVCDPQVLGGKPVLKGTRLSVDFVLSLLAAGWEKEDLYKNYPNLTADRLRAVLAYAADTFQHERIYPLPPVREPV